MTSQKDNSNSVSTETSKQIDVNTNASSAGNDSKETNSEKKDNGKPAGHGEYNSNTTQPVPLPISPNPNFYYTNGGAGYVDQQTAIAAEAYQAAMAAGYDVSDPNANAYAAYGQYGMHPQYSQFYSADYGAGYPGSPPLQGQTSPSLAPQSLSPYFAATSPPIAYYPTSPQVGPIGPTGIIHSPPMHPYLYSPNLHILSPTLSHTSSSAPNSPPPQYLPGPGVPSPKVGPLNSSNSRGVNRTQAPHYNYGRRNSGSNQIPTLPNFSNPTKTTNIYIRGLPPTTTDETLHTMCAM
jgi:hypothetical protein